jgi:hypothetical protein
VWRVLASVGSRLLSFHRPLQVSLGAVLALWARGAYANPPPVHLDVEACDSLDATSIRRIFAADLGTPTSVEVGPDVTEVTIGCEGDRVVVRVKDPLSRKTVRRSFDPKSFGNQGQSRLIAIAASELVLASWAELEANPTPKVLGEGEPVKAETVETARRVVKARAAKNPPPSMGEGTDNPLAGENAEVEQPAANSAHAPHDHTSAHEATPPSPVTQRLIAVFSARTFVHGEGTLTGGGARFGQDRFGVVSWAADALVEGGTLQNRNATSTSFGGWVAFYLHRDPATLRFGGGLRAGIIANPDGASVAAWGWPMLVSSLTLRMGPLVMDLAGETGLVDLVIQHSSGLRGVWVSGQAGLGLVL